LGFKLQSSITTLTLIQNSGLIIRFTQFNFHQSVQHLLEIEKVVNKMLIMIKCSRKQTSEIMITF